MLDESSVAPDDQERQRLLTALRESEILRELAELLASSLDLKRILETLAKRTTEACEVERCSVWLLEETHHVFRPAAYYLSTKRIDPNNIEAADYIWYHGSVQFDDPEILQLLKEQGIVFIDDLSSHIREKAIAERFLVRSVLLVALMREERIVGMMSLDDPDRVRTFSEAQQQLARAIGQQAALAIGNARLYEQAQAERERAERLANTLEAVFQAMTEGITVVDNEGEVLVRNNAAARFLGMPVNSRESLNMFLQRFPTYTMYGQPIPQEDFPLFRALRGERIRGERFMTVRGDGAERVVEVSVTPMLDEAKQRIGLVSAFRDITEQVRVEGRIRQALESMLNITEAVSGLTDIKDILHSVLEMTLATLDCERGVVQLYDREKGIFTPLLSSGFADEEAEKDWLKEQHRWLAPEENQYQGFRRQIMEGHATVINAEQYAGQSALYSHTMLLAVPITHGNRLLGLMTLDRSPSWEKSIAFKQEAQALAREFTIWDLTIVEGIAQLAGIAIEQARWQQEAISARASEAAMREANALKDDFLAITAHEFRTPLTVILAHSQVALRSLRKIGNQELTQRLRESLKTIEEQSHRLTNIVNTFLEVTHINRGQLALKLAPVDLVEVVKQVVTEQSAASPEYSISYSAAASERPYLVMGDRGRLLEIIANLVQNAIKYSPPGSPISISLRQYTSDEAQGRRTIEVCVEDRGIGIPKEALPRLFERFYRAPNTEGTKAKGIGLGLYLVAQLLRLHGGSIRAESSGIPGEGSRFIFTLPAIENGTIEHDRTSELAPRAGERDHEP